MIKRFLDIYHEFPRKFWVVVAVSFIDRLGGNMLWPFFTLYITGEFNVGMTQAGLVLGTFSAFGLIGNMIGGGLTDKFGRKSIILVGLVFSALSTLALGSVREFSMLIPLAVVIGLLSRISCAMQGILHKIAGSQQDCLDEDRAVPVGTEHR